MTSKDQGRQMNKTLEILATILSMTLMLSVVLFCVVLPISHIRGSAASSTAATTEQTGIVRRLDKTGLVFKGWEGALDASIPDLCQPDLIINPVWIRFSVSSEELLKKIQAAQEGKTTVTVVLDSDHFVVDVK